MFTYNLIALILISIVYIIIVQDCNRDSGVTLLFFFLTCTEVGESWVMLMSDICSIKEMVANGIS